MKTIKQDRKVLFGFAAAGAAAAAGFLLSKRKKAASKKTEAEPEYEIDYSAVEQADETEGTGSAGEDAAAGEEEPR